MTSEPAEAHGSRQWRRWHDRGNGDVSVIRSYPCPVTERQPRDFYTTKLKSLINS